MQDKFKKIRDALAAKKKDLIRCFLDGKESDFQSAHTRLIDEYFCDAFEKSAVGPRMEIDKNPYAIFALGGYGRSEQCLHSDIDLLFLFKKEVGDQTEDLIREIIYPLWDIGLEVGYATRSLKECLRLAGNDFEILTSLLDARFVCGISPLYLDLKEQLRKKIIRRKSRKIVKWYIENGRRRHRHFGSSANRLEPNLKEGRGGLRDYHTLLWIAHIRHHITEPRDLERIGYLSHNEFEDLSRALTFIWKVRNHLHYICGRKNDRLHFEYQEKLAEQIESDHVEGLKPVERFLGTLHRHMTSVKKCYQLLVDETYPLKKKSKASAAGTPVDGLRIEKHALTFVGAEKIVETPELLAGIFKESLRLQVPLCVEAKRLVREFSYLLDPRLSASPALLASFEKVLTTPVSDIDGLGDMLGSGFLESYIPEIKTILNRIEYNNYHIYSVAEHSLNTIRTLQSFGMTESTTDPLYGLLLGEIENQRLLYWAALLHDIGKGVPGKDHTISGANLTGEILTRNKGFSSDEIETVAFLVEHHLLLKQIATRRDIQDEETAVICARDVKETQRLKMLYLLTVADAMSTGPMAWSSWSEVLLKNFFLKVLRVLETGELASAAAVSAAERKKDRVLAAGASRDEKKRLALLYRMMSPRYILDTSAEEIINHVALYERLGQREFVWHITGTGEPDTRTVTICAKDRPGLFSKIAGVFMLNGIKVWSAQIYTWRNHVALDVFKVSPPPDQIFENERWKRTGENIEAVLAGTLDLHAAVKEKIPDIAGGAINVFGKPGKVVVDNESSSFFTIIEVFADDIPGLLFAIADRILSLQLDIWVAKIATKIDQIVNVFYVRDFDGQKVDQPEQVSNIKKLIKQVFCEDISADAVTEACF